MDTGFRFTILFSLLLLFAPQTQGAFPYDVTNFSDLSPATPMWQWEVSAAAQTGGLSDQKCTAVLNRKAGDPQYFLSWVSGSGFPRNHRMMSCSASEIGTNNCSAIHNTGFDLASEFGTCGTAMDPIYVPTSNDNVMVRAQDGRLVQVVQTIKLNCPPLAPPACGNEDREQVSYVIRVSDDCGQTWTPSVLDATAIRDLNGNLLSPALKNFDRVEAYSDPWSDHILLTAQTGTNQCSGATETAFLHASAGSGLKTFSWEQLFKHQPASVPTVMTSMPHTGGISRVYWFSCEGWKPTLFFADDPWNSPGGAPQIYKLDTLLQQQEGDLNTSQLDFECMLLPSQLNLCDPGSTHPKCANPNTSMGQGIHWECVDDPADPNACPAGTTSETPIRNLVFNTAIARVGTDGAADVIRVAYPQLNFTGNRYYQILRIVDVEVSPNSAGGTDVTPMTNRIIDVAANQATPASVFYPSIIPVDQTTTDDPGAATHMVRWTEFRDDGRALDKFLTWDPVKSWVGSPTCPQHGACADTLLWNPVEELDNWSCSGDCSTGDYQYGGFIDTLDKCTHRFFVPWGVQDSVSGIKTHGAMVTTSTDNQPPIFDSVPETQVVSCEAIPPAPNLSASDNCAADQEVPLADEGRQDGTCPDNYTLTRTWNATDNVGNTASESQTITVQDLIEPILGSAPQDHTVECDAVPAPAQLSASDNCDPNPMINFTEDRIDGSCPYNYELDRSWLVTDRCGNDATWAQSITVQDTTPPSTVTSTADLHCVWPPDHKYVCFDKADISPMIADNCSTSNTWEFVGCTSDQPDNAMGDGNTANDCIVNTDKQSICVRAERDGSVVAGRRYAVSIQAKDECGNTSPPVIIGNIHVPHSKKGTNGRCVH